MSMTNETNPGTVGELAERLNALASDCDNTDGWQGAADDVRAAARILAALTAEPAATVQEVGRVAVAWMYEKCGKVFINQHYQPWKSCTGWKITPLYAAPPSPQPDMGSGAVEELFRKHEPSAALQQFHTAIVNDLIESGKDTAAQYMRELIDLNNYEKRQAKTWRGIASAMGYEPDAHADAKPTSKWIVDRVAMFRAAPATTTERGRG